MVTIYDVSRSSSGLVSMNTVPYCLSSSRSMYQSHVGQQLIEKGNFTALLLLSEGAGVTYNELVFEKPQAEHEHAVQKVDIAITASSANASVLAGISPLGRQEFSQVDLQVAYEGRKSFTFRHLSDAYIYDPQTCSANTSKESHRPKKTQQFQSLNWSNTFRIICRTNPLDVCLQRECWWMPLITV